MNKEYSSCISKDPLIKFGVGSPPVIEYNMPIGLCLNPLGRIPFKIDKKYFKDDTQKIPADNFWSKVTVKSKDDIKNNLLRDISSGIPGSKYIANINVAQKFQNSGGTVTVMPGQGKGTLVRAGQGKDSGNAMEGRGAAPSLGSSIKLDIDNLAEAIKAKQMPFLKPTLGGEPRLILLPKPRKTNPQIYILEQYKICNFLGNYGVGKTLSTFTLLPGEKTTLTLKTFKDSESTRSKSENILDSFSQTSADEFEKTVKDESGTTNKDESSSSETDSASVEVSGGYGPVSASVGASTSETENTSQSRESMVSSMSSAMNKHAASSNSNRSLQVNTSTSETVKQGEESSTIREIENINRSRVLNFVFRELLQEYISVTYLTDIKIMYTNGYPESVKIVDLTRIDELLNEVIKPAEVEKVKEKIIDEYCCITDYKSEKKEFIEQVEEEKCVCYDTTKKPKMIRYWRKKKDLTQLYEDDNIKIPIPGIILNVQKITLKTPSVIGDALLGQGEALDCYNQKLQDAATEKAFLDNKITEQMMEIIQKVENPEERAKLYKKVFGECCEVEKKNDKE